MAALTGPTLTFPVDSTDRSTTAKAPLGTRAFDNAGNQYVYGKAGAAVGALQAVCFNGSATGWDDVRPTSAAHQVVIGCAGGTAFAENDYGFFQTRGVATVLATDAISAGAAVGSSATAGLLVAVDATAYGNKAGVVLVTNANADTDGATIYLMGA